MINSDDIVDYDNGLTYYLDNEIFIRFQAFKQILKSQEQIIDSLKETFDKKISQDEFITKNEIQNPQLVSNYIESFYQINNDLIYEQNNIYRSQIFISIFSFIETFLKKIYNSYEENVFEKKIQSDYIRRYYEAIKIKYGINNSNSDDKYNVLINYKDIRNYFVHPDTKKRENLINKGYFLKNNAFDTFREPTLKLEIIEDSIYVGESLLVLLINDIDATYRNTNIK